MNNCIIERFCYNGAVLGQFFILFLILFFSGGCAQTMEVSKTLWGSSTRALEEARVNGLTKTYHCSSQSCFEASLNVVQEKEYTVFVKDELKRLLVVMGVPGCVDTTEVGIFFTETNDKQTKIYVSSLSSNAKRIVAKNLFHGLDQIYLMKSLESAQAFE